jgi:hypothetical protein
MEASVLRGGVRGKERSGFTSGSMKDVERIMDSTGEASSSQNTSMKISVGLSFSRTKDAGTRRVPGGWHGTVSGRVRWPRPP